MISPLAFTIAAVPAAIYLMMLGRFRLSRRPMVTTVARWRRFWYRHHGIGLYRPDAIVLSTYAAARFAGWVWGMLLALYLLSVLLIVLGCRPRLIVYGLDEEGFMRALGAAGFTRGCSRPLARSDIDAASRRHAIAGRAHWFQRRSIGSQHHRFDQHGAVDATRTRTGSRMPTSLRRPSWLARPRYVTQRRCVTADSQLADPVRPSAGSHRAARLSEPITDLSRRALAALSLVFCQINNRATSASICSRLTSKCVTKRTNCGPKGRAPMPRWANRFTKSMAVPRAGSTRKITMLVSIFEATTCSLAVERMAQRAAARAHDLRPALDIVIQRVQTSGCENADLAHATAEQFASAPASRTNSVVPASNETNRAPRPLEKQMLTESNGALQRASETPLATTALNKRAPSR